MITSLPARLRATTPALRALLLADGLFMLATMIGAVAVPWWISAHGGAAHLALQGVVGSCCAFIAAPLLGPLGDRHEKRWLIAVGLAGLALVALLLAVVAGLEHYAAGWVIVYAMLGSLAGGLAMPALMTLAAELVRAEALPEALSLQRSAQSLGRVLGPLVAGVALALSTGAALGLQALLLLAAVALALRLPRAKAAPRAARTWASWRADLRAGLRACWAMPLERGWTLVNFVGVIFMVPAFTMLVPLKVRALGLGAAWLGAAEAGLSVGMLIGALGGSAWVAQRIGRYATRVGATAAQGLCLALAGAADHGAVLVLALFGVGLANSCGVLVGQTHRMLAIPQHFRARVQAVGTMSLTVASALGPALAGLALTQASVASVYIGFGLAAGLSALGFLLVPDFRLLMAQDHEMVKDWYARRHPELFGPVASP